MQYLSLDGTMNVFESARRFVVATWDFGAVVPALSYVGLRGVANTSKSDGRINSDRSNFFNPEIRVEDHVCQFFETRAAVYVSGPSRFICIHHAPLVLTFSGVT